MCLRASGHADDLRELTQHPALCPGGEARPLDAHVCTPVMDREFERDCVIREVVTEGRAEGVCKGDVYGLRPIVERVVPGLRVVDELVREDEIARLIFLLQRAHRGRGDDPADAQAVEGPDICAVVDRMGWDRVPLAMPGQEGDWDPTEVP